MQPQYTITLSREEISRNASAYTVTNDGALKLIIPPSTDNGENLYLAVNYGPRLLDHSTEHIRRHLADAWRQEQLPRVSTDVRRTLVAMARELYERDPCALADLLAEAHERGTTPAFTATWTTLDPEQLPDLLSPDDPDFLPF